MHGYSDSINAVKTINPDDVKLTPMTNLLSLGMLGLAMAILWVLLFGF